MKGGFIGLQEGELFGVLQQATTALTPHLIYNFGTYQNQK